MAVSPKSSDQTNHFTKDICMASYVDIIKETCEQLSKHPCAVVNEEFRINMNNISQVQGDNLPDITTIGPCVIEQIYDTAQIHLNGKAQDMCAVSIDQWNGGLVKDAKELLQCFEVSGTLLHSTSVLLMRGLLETIIRRMKSQYMMIPSDSVTGAVLDETEEQVVRYAAGYIVKKILKKYEDLKYEELVSVVKKWTIQPSTQDASSDLFQYTQLMVNLLDRGGLYKVTDSTFSFFRQIESLVKPLLCCSMLCSRIEERVILDPLVQAEWEKISCDIDDNFKDDLLRFIVRTWCVMRGHSYSNALVFVRQQKQGKKSSQQALRQELKHR